jgi:glycosyltransferase involved in cell wall biosynthesis
MKSPPRVRVLLVIESLGTGGTERSVAEALAPLRNRGIETTIVCLHDRPGVLDEVLAQGFEVHFLRGGWFRRLLELRSLIRRLCPSIVHTALPRTDILGRLASAGSGTRVLSSIVLARYGAARRADPRLSPWKLEVLRRVDGWTARHLADQFHAVSNAAKADAVAALGIAPQKVTVIPRGRSEHRLGRPSQERRARAREVLGLEAADPVVVNIGRQVHSKGQRYLIEAIALLREDRPSIRALVAGSEGPESAELERRIRESGLEHNVSLLGARNDVPDILAAADVFAFPSLYEGMPGAVIEALALGLPIVATDIPTLREILVAGDHALLAPPGDAAALSRGIAHLLEDRPLARRMGERNRAFYEESFTLDRSVARTAELYHTLAGAEPEGG